MASPKLSNGYLKIANELLDAIIKADFTLSESKVVWSVIRYSYGYNQKQCFLSLKFIEQNTNLSVRQIQRTIKQLICKNVLIELKKPSHSSAREIMLNKDYSKWELGEVTPMSTDDTDVYSRDDIDVYSGDDTDVYPINNNNINTTINTTYISAGKPSLPEVEAYITEKGYSVNPQRFFDYYEERKWKVKNWKLNVETWEDNNRRWNGEKEKEDDVPRDVWGKPIVPKYK